MVEEGDRIELVSTSDPYTELEEGCRGIVEKTEELPPEVGPGNESETQVWVSWDNGSELMLIEDQDEYEVLEER